jgi:L-fuculose-phosphate aldolase
MSAGCSCTHDAPAAIRRAREIVRLCRRLAARGWVAACDGNVSARLDDDRILVTPTGHYKTQIVPAELAEICLDGRVVRGQPTSELALHLAVYQSCPEARVVVHAHPPIATAWTVARPDLDELPVDCVAEVILGVGRIPFVDYARPGSPGVAAAVTPYLPGHRVLVLRRHGALAWGESGEEAFAGIDRLEHSAQLLLAAQTIGGLTPLPREEVEELRRLRRARGARVV